MKSMINRRIAAILSLAMVLTSAPVNAVYAYTPDIDISNGYIVDEGLAEDQIVDEDTSNGYIIDEEIPGEQIVDNAAFDEYVNAFSDEDIEAEGDGGTINNSVTWDITGGKLTVTGSGEIRDTSGVIPWSSRKNSITSAVIDLKNTKDLSGMFEDCANLASVDLSKLDTSSATDMNSMFSGCIKLRSLDLSKFKTSKVKNMACMFSSCKELTSLTLNSFDTSHVTNMSSMFYGCEKLVSLDLSTFKTSTVQYMNGMFENCLLLNSINMNRWDIDAATDMSNMFKNCKKITEIPMSKFSRPTVAVVKNVSGMFENCVSLNKLDMSRFDVENVTDMSRMFYNCKNLGSVDVSGFSTIKVTDMKEMFYGCELINELDLSSFNIVNVEYATDMLKKCNALVSVKAPKNPTVSGKTYIEIVLPNSGWVRRDTNSSVTALTHDIPQGTLVTIGGDPTPMSDILDSGSINDTVFWVLYKNGTLSVNGIGEIHDSDGKVPWLIHTDAILTAVIDLKGTVDLSGMFEGCDKIDNINMSRLDTSSAMDMSYMFKGCSLLRNATVAGFDTEKVTRMKGMFEGCSSIASFQSFRFSTFNTINVTDMSDMFKGCSSVTRLDLSNFDLRNIETTRGADGMLDDCTALNTVFSPADPSCDIDLPGEVWLNLASGKRVKEIPSGITAGTEFTLTDDIECGNYKNVWWWIDKNKVLYVQGSGDIHDMSQASPWSLYTDNIETADITLTGASDLSRMFEGCDKLRSIRWTSFDTSDCTNMYGMFRYCKVLSSVDLSGFDTSNVTEMEYMFEGCEALTALDVSTFNTKKVFDMRGMFRNCLLITQLDISNFDMSGITEDYRLDLIFENDTRLNSVFAPKNIGNPITLPVISGMGWKLNGAGPGERVLAIPTNATAGDEYITAYDITRIELWDATSNRDIKASYELTSGQTLKIRATVSPSYADAGDIVWGSSDLNVATVSVNGSAQGNIIFVTVTAGEGPGSSVISASFKDVSADPVVIKVAGAVSVSPGDMVLKSGAAGVITASVNKAQYTVASLVWTSDMPDVVSVSGNSTGAVVTAENGIKEDIFVTITASTPDGLYSDICIIKVIPDPNEPVVDWGDIDDQDIKDLFGNDPDNVPKGIWYLMPDNGGVTASGNRVDHVVLSGSAALDFSRIYTGSEITFDKEIFVFYGVRKLWAKRDYRIIYRNNKAAARNDSKKPPYFTIDGIGSFQNNEDFKFNILPDDINNAVLTSDAEVVIDNKTKIGTITPVIRYDGNKLVLNRDYTLTYYKGTVSNGQIVYTEETNPKKRAAVTGETFYIKITAKSDGNFTGDFNTMIKLTTVDPSDRTVVKINKVKVKIAQMQWTGEPYNLREMFDNTLSDNEAIRVVHDNYDLIYGTDFTVDDITYTDAGKYTFKIYGTASRNAKGVSYLGEKSVNLEITGTLPSKVKFAAMNNAVNYTGEEITIEDLYKDDGSGFDKVTLYTMKAGKMEPLIEGRDYDYVMENSGATGRFSFVATLKGGYTGVKTKTIRVLQYNIYNDVRNMIKITAEDATFCKSGSIPKVTVKFGNRTLQEGIDYKLSFKNNNKIGLNTDGHSAPAVTVTGIGNFSGKVTQKFTIKKAPMENIKLVVEDKEYKDKFVRGYYKSSPKIMDGDKLLKIGSGKDIESLPKNAYKYYYANTGQEIDSRVTHIDANTLIEVRVTITCSDASPYVRGTKELKGYYRMLDTTKDVRNAKVYLNTPEELVCSDTEAEIRELLKKNLVVTIKGTDLVEDRDYKIVSVENYRTPGKATIKLEGVGNYGGKTTFTFKMYRRKQ